MRRVGPASHRLRRALVTALADLAPDEPVLVACSGGPDSLALAAVTAALDRPAGAVVVDHRVQPGSAAAAARAAGQCRELGLDPVCVATVTVTGSGGREAAARTARYEALRTTATEHRAAAVLLGHTREDQAETVLLGLARGSGTRSLAGMAAVRDVFRRPWLEQPRSLVLAALAESGLDAWHDPHNGDPALLRGRVRHRVMPVLESGLGPGVAAALARTATLARQDADALDAWARAQHDALGAGPWQVATLAGLPVAVRGRVIRMAALAAGSPGTDLTADHVAEVDRLVTDWHGQGPITLPGGVTASRACGRLAVQGDMTQSGVVDGAG